MSTTPTPLLALYLLLGACGGGGGAPAGGAAADTTPPVIRLTALRVQGTTSAAASVTVRGVADQDGAADAVFRVDFALDGGVGATSLPADAGGAIDCDLPINVQGVVHDLRLQAP